MPKARNDFHPESSHIIGGDKWIGKEISSIKSMPKIKERFSSRINAPPPLING